MNWLRAKARYDRWDEDLVTIRHEMGWTVRYFRHQSGKWEKRGMASSEVGKEGHAAYAKKQAGMWSQFATEGTRKFGTLMK